MSTLSVEQLEAAVHLVERLTKAMVEANDSLAKTLSSQPESIPRLCDLARAQGRLQGAQDAIEALNHQVGK